MHWLEICVSPQSSLCLFLVFWFTVNYSLYELHAFIIELISNFEFELTPEAEHIRRHPCLVVAPMIEGRENEGAQLPLRIRVAVKGE